MKKGKNFTCWMCNKNFFYSPDYRNKHIYCEECLNKKENIFLKILRKANKLK